MKSSILIFLCLFIYSCPISAQSKWNIYPPTVNAVAVEGDHFWLGLGNKIVKWNKQQRILAEYTQQDGHPGSIFNELYVGRMLLLK
jgi:hypothetical protein